MKYLFYIAKSYSLPIIRPLLDLMVAQKRDYAIYLSQRVFERLPQDYASQPIITRLEDAISSKADYVIVPGNFVDYRIPGVKLQIFHGLGVEKQAHFRNRGFFDAYFCSGPYVTRRFEAMRQRNPYFEVIETGWLKMDAILSYDKSQIPQELKLPLGKKVILYAPTFSRSMESAAELAPFIPALIRPDEYWLLKFHSLMPKELIEPFKALPSTQVQIYQGADISACLHASDLMISDTSSVVYEFAALDKPVITYKSIARQHKAYNIRDPQKLRAAIDYCLSKPDELMQRQKAALMEVNPYLDGSIARRTLEALDSLDPGSFPRRGKPLNLFRKAQLHYHSLFKKGYIR